MTDGPGLRLTLTRLLPAPRERVFHMLTAPAELVTWWGPHGTTLLSADVDLRVDGSYRFVMEPPGGSPFHLSGRFLSVDPPRGLSYTFRYEEPTPDDRETVVTLALEDRGQETALSLDQGEFATEERLALHRNGWSDSLERLEAAVGVGSTEPDEVSGRATFGDVAPVLPVRDLSAALERYRLLGFQVRPYGHGTGYGYAEREKVTLHLSEWDEHDPLRTGSQVYLFVSDADAVHAEWSASGVQGRFTEPGDTEYGLREFAYVDPDGTLHRVGSPLR